MLATQNPIEHEGTYPLPEAQVDRFMFKLVVGLPGAERGARGAGPHDAHRGARRSADARTPSGCSSRGPLVQSGVHRRARSRTTVWIWWSRRAIRRTRGSPDLAPLIEYGASPRAAIFLLRAAKAHAFLHGRATSLPDDIKALALDVLRHRLILTYEAEAEEITPEIVIGRVLDNVAVP